MDNGDLAAWADAVEALERAGVMVRKAKEAGHGALIAHAMQALDRANSRYVKIVATFDESDNHRQKETSMSPTNDRSPLVQKQLRSN